LADKLAFWAQSLIIKVIIFSTELVAMIRILVLTALSLVAFNLFAADTDGDGVDDLQDAYPNDAAKQYLPAA